VNAADLILAVLGSAAQANVSLSKTKLLKLLYLVDLEVVRASGQTATRWHWTFLHFGPWTGEYDRSLEALRERGFISITTLPGDRETQLIRSERSDVDVSTISERPIRLAARQVLGRWLPEDLPGILDYVYFDTEPMQNVKRGADLNFATVRRHEEVPYSRETSPGGAGKVREVRKKLGLLDSKSIVVRESRAEYVEPSFTPARYDDAALELLRTLEDD